MADLFDVVVHRRGSRRRGGGADGPRARAARSCASTRRTFLVTRRAATGSPPTHSRLLEQLGLDRSTFTATGAELVTETVIVSPRGRQVRLPLPRNGTHAGGAPRGVDAALVDHARASGDRPPNATPRGSCRADRERPETTGARRSSVGDVARVGGRRSGRAPFAQEPTELRQGPGVDDVVLGEPAALRRRHAEPHQGQVDRRMRVRVHRELRSVPSRP